MILNSIENFWVQWFASSDGTVKGFGMPELQTGIQ
jgi:hypothetical protein